MFQCAPDTCHFPLHLMVLTINQPQCSFEVMSRLLWNCRQPIVIRMMLRESAQQSCLSSLTQNDFPF